MMTDRQFCQFFCMSKVIFHILCDEVEKIVGVNTFKNENYLDEVLHSENPCRHRMLVANECTTGGFICGEIKLATTL